jgi:hypothetical protein
MKLRRKLIHLLAASAMASAMIMILPSTSAFATGTTCNLGSGFTDAFHTEQIYECGKVVGGGLHIGHLEGWVYEPYSFEGPLAHVHIELQKIIKGKTYHIKNCPAQTIPGGGSTSHCTWSPNSNEAAGQYCAIGWQYLPWYETYWQMSAAACVNVHS